MPLWGDSLPRLPDRKTGLALPDNLGADLLTFSQRCMNAAVLMLSVPELRSSGLLNQEGLAS